MHIIFITKTCNACALKKNEDIVVIIMNDTKTSTVVRNASLCMSLCVCVCNIE